MLIVGIPYELLLDIVHTYVLQLVPPMTPQLPFPADNAPTMSGIHLLP